MSPKMSFDLSKHGTDFINDDAISSLLHRDSPDPLEVRDILAKSMNKEALTPVDTAVLLTASQPDLVEEIFQGARELKRSVYGNRIVLFAPLYIGSKCVNDCYYCAFKRSNKDAVRRTLTQEELAQQVESLVNRGHKRLILVWGEHPDYGPEFMAECVRTTYGVKSGHGEIRRVNINAAPLDHRGYAEMKKVGIGTYQIFQETYHHATYRRNHPENTIKGDYLWRLDGLSRALEAECDDVGIGALFGLYDWRFEVMGLVTHSRFLQQHYGVGPHTISFPRIRPAAGVNMDPRYFVSDRDFKRLIAILRLAVPYTGLILTARENADLRRDVMAFGVSQIDAGSRIEIGGYTEAGDAQVMEREQFMLDDIRSLDSVIRELIQDGYIPSFCTSCYRLGRTGEHFMEFAIPGFIKRYCTPNALTTMQEYLVDYASPETRSAGRELIQKELNTLEDGPVKTQLLERLHAIEETDQRDMYF